MKRYDKEMAMLSKAYREAMAGVKVTKVKVIADDLKELKSKLAEYGYKYVVNKKAYETANDLGTDRFIKIHETDDFYYTVVTVFSRV